ncbi:hypothetical protein [uncultured Hymenobacter sp.]|uniref:hypothetical protein n=1 Tax=uncultured Hymenobacter sp. TaxID=170016 RepID=UPI0035CBEC87
MMRPNEYHVILQNFPTTPGKLPLRLMGPLSERLLNLAVSVVRLNFEGRSDRPGKQPEWVRSAADISCTALERDGKTGLSLEAPQLGNVLVGGAYQEFFKEPLGTGDVARESALGLTIQAIQQATGQIVSPNSGGLVDRGVLRQMQNLADLFPADDDEASLLIHNEQPSSRVVINRRVLRELKTSGVQIPAPERVQISGQLEAMQFSAADARVVVGNRKIRIHVPTPLLHGLGQFFGQNVLVQGQANFNAAGQITAIEAKSIAEATPQQLTFFQQLPRSLSTAPSLDQLRKEQNYKGNDVARMRQLAREMNIQASYEDLLEQLRDHA